MEQLKENIKTIIKYRAKAEIDKHIKLGSYELGMIIAGKTANEILDLFKEYLEEIEITHNKELMELVKKDLSDGIGISKG